MNDATTAAERLRKGSEHYFERFGDGWVAKQESDLCECARAYLSLTSPAATGTELDDEQYGRAWAKMMGIKPNRTVTGLPECQHHWQKESLPDCMHEPIVPFGVMWYWDSESEAYAALGRAVREIHKQVPMLDTRSTSDAGRVEEAYTNELADYRVMEQNWHEREMTYKERIWSLERQLEACREALRPLAKLATVREERHLIVFRQDAERAAALLAGGGDDGGEAITEEWLRSVGFTTDPTDKSFMLLRANDEPYPTYIALSPDDMGVVGGGQVCFLCRPDDATNEHDDDFVVFKQNTCRTRGQLRDLCRCLGIPLEKAKGR